MSRQHDIEHRLDINEVYILLQLVRKEVDRQIKERSESITEPDWFDEALHELSEKLERCHSGMLYENLNSDDIARLVSRILPRL